MTTDFQSPVPDEIIGVFFEDTSYGLHGDTDEPSSKLKMAIEREVGGAVEEVDIGPGASFPAWLFSIDPVAIGLGGLAIAAFFQGKRINEDLDGWIGVAKKLKGLVHRKSHLSRSAAAALAIDELMAQIGDYASSELQLLSYSVFDSRFEKFVDARAQSAGPRIDYQGVTIHVFEFEIDGKRFLAVVDGRDVAIRHNGLAEKES